MLIDLEWEKLVQEFDVNNDGMINFEEFKMMMGRFYESAMEGDIGAQLAGLVAGQAN